MDKYWHIEYRKNNIGGWMWCAWKDDNLSTVFGRTIIKKVEFTALTSRGLRLQIWKYERRLEKAKKIEATLRKGVQDA